MHEGLEQMLIEHGSATQGFIGFCLFKRIKKKGKDDEESDMEDGDTDGDNHSDRHSDKFGNGIMYEVGPSSG